MGRLGTAFKGYHRLKALAAKGVAYNKAGIKKTAKYADRLLQKIGNPSKRTGARISGAEKLLYGAEIGAGAYTVAKLRSLGNKRNQKSRVKRVRRVTGGGT